MAAGIPKKVGGEEGVAISERHVPNLLRLYLAMVGARTLDSDAVRKRLQAQGRLILSVDGVRFDDVSPAMYVVRELISGEILASERIKVADTKSLSVEKVKALGLPVSGIISDKEHAQVAAVRKVFPGVPHQYCQTHFFGHLVKPMESELAELAKGVEKVAKEASDLKKTLDSSKDKTHPLERQIVGKFCEAVRVISKTRGDKILHPPALKRFNKLANLETLTVTAVTAVTVKTGQNPSPKAVEEPVAKAADEPAVKPAKEPTGKKSARPGALLQKLLTIFTLLASYKELARRLTRQVEIVRDIAHILGLALSGKESESQLEGYLKTLTHNPETGRGAPMGRFQGKVKEITVDDSGVGSLPATMWMGYPERITPWRVSFVCSSLTTAGVAAIRATLAGF